ncbi:DUF488 domain-containing protein [Ruania zhangjianzhongii]|uniref:DUF488 domain-containing protein n=1 Tax=Ruania zhangjianzhongii TaxID=2603206 RepID=UPI0011CB7B39|nr:DUF488 family protein [Ruania zhangjianzhongii]
MRSGRVYDEVSDDDGTRVLVDRVWPRGIRKEDPRVGHWLKDVAPSDELRKWYGHDPDKNKEFATRYRAELKEDPAAGALDELRDLARQGEVTLVTATKDVSLSQVPVLQQVAGV